MADRFKPSRTITIPNAALRDTRLTSVDLRTLISLLAYQDTDGYVRNMTVEQIGWFVSLSGRSTRRGTAHLKHLGYIDIIQPRDVTTGRVLPVAYRLYYDTLTIPPEHDRLTPDYVADEEDTASADVDPDATVIDWEGRSPTGYMMRNDLIPAVVEDDELTGGQFQATGDRRR